LLSVSFQIGYIILSRSASDCDPSPWDHSYELLHPAKPRNFPACSSVLILTSSWGREHQRESRGRLPAGAAVVTSRASVWA
jgi:hypothetical protein